MDIKWYSVLILASLLPTVLSATVVSSIENFTAPYDSYKPAEETKLLSEEKQYWNKKAEEVLINTIKQAEAEIKHVAKNVIIFVGDGMGATTATAARIYKGQREFGLMGEEHTLSFEKFPNVALVKTYTVDKQVPDSAGTATAIFTGVKTRSKVVGLDATVSVSTFESESHDKSKLDSIMVWAQQAGKHTGVVSTTKVTDATPAALYAHVSDRDWECDSKIPVDYRHKVKDIARQLVEDEPGKNFKVILAGGLQMMGYVSNVNTEKCSREDNLNVTQLWLNSHNQTKREFVVNTQGLESISNDTEYLLGLFSASHMPYELLRNKGPQGTPSLSAMTKKAIQHLKKGPNGFVLMVEGGLIDTAHHKNYARLAISEAAEFDEAVLVALNETDSDTLILVTSDHSHTLTLNGYADRGNDILGYNKHESRLPYLTLSYSNGPGFKYHFESTDDQFPYRDVSVDKTHLNDPKYQYLATFFKKDETHGGEDVPIYATGPCSHLVRGVMEQNMVAHIVSYAACMGPQTHLNKHCSDPNICTNLTYV